MPVEIRELQITAVIEDEPRQNANPSTSTSTQVNTEAIVAACVEQVLDILKQKSER